MLYNTTQWNSVFNKGPARFCIHTSNDKVYRWRNTWNVRLGRWGGSKDKGWTHVINNINGYSMLMVF